MSDINSISDIRRANLLALIEDKYEGNRSAFSRATGKNVNLINLVLTANPDFRRNIGERLARDLEELASLPKGWLDLTHTGGPTGQMATFQIMRLGRDGESLENLTLASDVIARQLDAPTSMRAVKACYMPTDDMAPAINKGDLMFVDSGVTQIAKDGVYVIVVNEDLFVRRVKKTLSGAMRASADKDPQSVEDLPGSAVIAGRIVGLMKFAQP